MSIKLSPEDPTVFAKCPVCCRRGTGISVGAIYMKAFTVRRWKRQPLCENCDTPLVALYEIEIDDS